MATKKEAADIIEKKLQECDLDEESKKKGLRYAVHRLFYKSKRKQ